MLILKVRPLIPPHQIKEREDDMSMLGFCDHKKISSIINVMLSSVIIPAIANHDVSYLLIDDRNTCNLMYMEIFRRLGLQMQDLKPYKDKSLLAIHSSIVQRHGYDYSAWRMRKREKCKRALLGSSM